MFGKIINNNNIKFLPNIVDSVINEMIVKIMVGRKKTNPFSIFDCITLVFISM